MTNGATRILSVLGKAKTRDEALRIVYSGVKQIRFGNDLAAHRDDIGWAA